MALLGNEAIRNWNTIKPSSWALFIVLAEVKDTRSKTVYLEPDKAAEYGIMKTAYYDALSELEKKNWIAYAGKIGGKKRWYLVKGFPKRPAPIIPAETGNSINEEKPANFSVNAENSVNAEKSAEDSVNAESQAENSANAENQAEILAIDGENSANAENEANISSANTENSANAENQPPQNSVNAENSANAENQAQNEPPQNSAFAEFPPDPPIRTILPKVLEENLRERERERARADPGEDSFPETADLVNDDFRDRIDRTLFWIRQEKQLTRATFAAREWLDLLIRLESEELADGERFIHFYKWVEAQDWVQTVQPNLLLNQLEKYKKRDKIKSKGVKNNGTGNYDKHPNWPARTGRPGRQQNGGEAPANDYRPFDGKLVI